MYIHISSMSEIIFHQGEKPPRHLQKHFLLCCSLPGNLPEATPGCGCATPAWQEHPPSWEHAQLWEKQKGRKEDAVYTEDSPVHINTNAKYKPQKYEFSLKYVIVFERTQKLQLLSCFQQQMYSTA